MYKDNFFSPETKVSEVLAAIEDNKYYNFGVMTSSVHMAWMRAVCGRLEQSYRYSKDIVYNNFVWPQATFEQKKHVAQTARKILAVREPYLKAGKTLAWLYNATMPQDLLAAHEENDRAVMDCYGFNYQMTEEEIVRALMALNDYYQTMEKAAEINRLRLRQVKK